MANRNYLDDYAALEADVLLTSILYTRVKASKIKWNVLSAKIKFLKNKLFLN